MQKRALLFQGGWEGHRPADLALRFEKSLASRGFAVDITDSLDCLDDGDSLKAYDLIIPGWTMGKLDGERENNLCDAVRSGTGLAGIHGTMGDAFRGAIDYEWMVGGHFVGHPYVGPYTVRVEQPDHFLTLEIPETFVYDSEQYYLQIDPGINVLLSTTYDLGSGSVTMPVCWTKCWGNGRVFYSALGHSPEEFDQHPYVWEMTISGALWASR